MSFVANFLKNTTVENFENRPIFVKVMNECIMAQFLTHYVDLVVGHQVQSYKPSFVLVDYSLVDQSLPVQSVVVDGRSLIP